jgi:uncharacterized protein
MLGATVLNVLRDACGLRFEIHGLNAKIQTLAPSIFREVTLMAISEDLLEILACPACKAKVELQAGGQGLKCVQCRRVYPIRDDIPVMLIEEATIEGEEEQPRKES